MELDPLRTKLNQYYTSYPDVKVIVREAINYCKELSSQTVRRSESRTSESQPRG